MKKLLFLLTCSIVSLPLMAQLLNEDDPSCREKCIHGHISSREQQVDYYQYPSLGKYDVRYLKLDLKAEAGTRVMSGIATTVVFSVQALDSFNIELKNNMVVDSVYINGVKRNFSRGSDFIFVPLAPVIPAGNLVTTVIYYNGTAGSAGVFAGTVGSNGLTYTATLSESYQAREWFPVKQILSDKIDSADIWVTTSAINKVGSNGLLMAVVDSPNSKKQYQWKTRYPMNYYMPSISIGNYMAYTNYAKPLEMAPDSIPILHYIVDNTTYFNSVVANLNKTPAFIEKFSELFGLYPFKNEKYGHSHASIGGGMEHQTMTTTSSFSSTIIAHELGHQWWGDQVTCATWNHIWLNEGFASYCEYLAIEKLPALFSPTTASGFMQSVHNNVMSSATGSVYVPEASVFDENRIFSSRLSYNKGSAIIHNLRFEMQDDNLFFQALKNYQTLYKNSVATADDFKTVAENTCGRSFTDFFNQWYYGEGYPTFNITFLKQGSDTLVLLVNESVSAPAITPFFKGLLELKVVSEQGDTTVKVNLSANDQVFKFRYTKTPDNIIIDPNNWVLNANGIITNGGTIPVKLLTYTVSSNSDCSAQLQWKAGNEDNSKQYEVEISTDGLSYTKIAVISSKHLENSTYNLYHPLPGTGLYYFRLKLVDLDGRYGYSKVILLNKNCSGIITAEIIPNPVIDRFNIKTWQPATENTIIRIYDTKGSEIYKESRMLNAGENNIPLNITSRFSPGQYLLRLENRSGVISRKFIKL